MAKKATAPEPEPAGEVLELGVAPTYAVRLAIKTPSQNVQYRMIEAEVTCTSTDFEEALENAQNGLDHAVIKLCEAWSEPYPDELNARLGSTE